MTNENPRVVDGLTHLDATGQPAMVDVSGKAFSARQATAECLVVFQLEVSARLRRDALRSAQGGIADTTVITGKIAVKRTHELIRFCHPLPIDGYRLATDWHGPDTLRTEYTVRTTHRTGVEIKALTGATLAASTVYDMCKALSHQLVLGPARLLCKHGGKRDFGGAP